MDGSLLYLCEPKRFRISCLDNGRTCFRCEFDRAWISTLQCIHTTGNTIQQYKGNTTDAFKNVNETQKIVCLLKEARDKNYIQYILICMKFLNNINL